MATNTRNGTNNDKGNKFVNLGACAGGFAGGVAGGMASTLTPPINININRASHAHTQSRSLLPAPEFTSPAQVRNYCNTVRAAGVTLSIEVAMGAEILQGVLGTVPDPEGKTFGSRIRAAKVARKLRKSANALRSAAKNAAACYATFQQEYEEEINRVRHRARKPRQPVIDWAQQ
ncbi:plasmid transfer protein TraA [Streptomyces formicae]